MYWNNMRATAIAVCLSLVTPAVSGILAGGTALLSPSAAMAACDEFPRFNPTANTPSGNVWEADRFVDSIGTNLHIGQGPYVSDFNTRLKPRLDELNIRYARTNARGVLAHPDQILQLGQLGIRFLVVTPDGVDLKKLLATVKSIGPNYFLGIEGLNEPENKYGCANGGTCWVNPTREHQKDVYNTFKSDPMTRGILILGPGLKGITTKTAPQQLGNLSDYMDVADMHKYRMAGRSPESKDYIATLNNYMTYVAKPTMPAILTETGYSTNKGGTTENEDATFMPRIFLYNFDHGLRLTSKYDFLDSNTGNGDRLANFGYIRSNNTVKPSFTAVKNMISLLSDPGARFSPATLSYSLSGKTDGVYKVLMQKRDGTYYLALWLAKPGTSLAAQSVNINLPSLINSAASVKPNDGAIWKSLSISGGKVTLPVDDQVTLVKLTPKAAGKPALCRR